MGWDASLIATDVDGNRFTAREWNYTHNCNGMIAIALDERPDLRGYWIAHLGSCWWDLFYNHAARDVQHILDQIVGGLEANSERCRKLNPENGWGDYDSLLSTFIDMQRAALQYPSAIWDING